MESLLLLFGISFIAALTPGPDLLVILRHSLLYGARHGFFAWLGVFMGMNIYLWIVYLGVAYFLQQAWIQACIGIIGGAYLLYIAYLLAFKSHHNMRFDAKSAKQPPLFLSLRQGFIVNISNPKFIIFLTTFFVPFAKNLNASLAIFALGTATAFWSMIWVASCSRHFLSNTLFGRLDKICALLFVLFAVFLFFHVYAVLNHQ